MTSRDLLRLSEVATIVRGTARPKAMDLGAGQPFFGIDQILEGGNGPMTLVEPGNRRDITTVRAGDVVIALVDRVGLSVLVTSRHAGAILGSGCVAVRPSGPQVNGAWIYVWTQSSQFRSQVGLRTIARTKTLRLSHRTLSDMTIPLPPTDCRTQQLLQAQQFVARFDSALLGVAELQSQLLQLRSHEADLILANK